MYMAYSTNPHLPRVRREAVNFVLAGASTREAARHFGYTHSAIVKWLRRASGNRREYIPTGSSRPWRHPRELSPELVERIIAIRQERGQCAEVIHHRLAAAGATISLSSVKRTLKRNGLVYPSKWKKWHQYPERPMPEKPGILVEIDSMREGVSTDALYAYALIDVCSRWAYAEACPRISTHESARFVAAARGAASFRFSTLQSDHGSEFSKWFTKQCTFCGIVHRHSRVRTPTDNAHVERFILTLQKQCLKRVPASLRAWRREIPEFLRWYNHERPHMALDMRTPVEFLNAVPSY